MAPDTASDRARPADSPTQGPAVSPPAAGPAPTPSWRPELWAKTSDAGRKAIAEAVFERIDVLGASDYTFTLTAAARARGWDAAFGPGVLRLESQGGRGKTEGPDAPRNEGVLSTKEGQYGRGERRQTSTTDLNVPVTWRLPIRLVA